MRKRTRHSVNLLVLGIVAAAAAVVAAACNNSQGGFGGSVGNTPNRIVGLTFGFFGTAGEPFTATMTDAIASWNVQGVTPLRVLICNNSNPAAVEATHTGSDTNLLSVQITRGTAVVQTGSTSTPGGQVSLRTKPGFDRIAPPANPDLRIFVSGPALERFSYLVEDQSQGFIGQTNAPAMFMYETPNGKVDGQFMQIQNFGAFTVSMSLDGNVVATATGAPTVTIQEP
ncbi:MAG TPA: hypothetical protein VMU16_06545 [Candidatus Binataceae bacterium]|nr:hypothetical protein [Candidatus Binataceae bacterium]